MQKNRGIGITPAGGIFTGKSFSTMADEINFRRRRLETEATHERLAGPRDGLRQRVGQVTQALMAFGHVDHVRVRRPHPHGHRA